MIIDTQLAFNTPRHSEQHTKGWLPVGRDDLVPGKESKPLTFGGISLARRPLSRVSGPRGSPGKGVRCPQVIALAASKLHARAPLAGFFFRGAADGERRSVVLLLG